jgi:hypothetical protein
MPWRRPRHQEGDDAEFGLEAGHQLQRVLGQLRRPAGQLGDPEQPDQAAQHGQHHHREPVDGVDGAALHGRQAEGGHHGQRRQQLEQVAVFRLPGRTASAASSSRRSSGSTMCSSRLWRRQAQMAQAANGQAGQKNQMPTRKKALIEVQLGSQLAGVPGQPGASPAMVP